MILGYVFFLPHKIIPETVPKLFTDRSGVIQVCWERSVVLGSSQYLAKITIVLSLFVVVNQPSPTPLSL